MTGFDTGGINWQINVRDGFTGPLTDFVQLTEQARRTAEAAARAQTQANRQQAQDQRELAARVRQQAAIERERAAIYRTQRRDVTQAAAAARAAIQPIGSLTSQFKNFQAALRSGTAEGNRLVFTLRNIIGVGAGLAVIQQVQGAFRGLVTVGIDFNKELENSRVGIAGLLTAVTDVFDAQGKLVTGAEAFSIAQGIAIKQVDKLRQSTLKTTATFEELANTFQIAVAPGLKAGLNIDQIRELSVAVSQAAGALGVPTNQLSEEIRALLTGTIQARTTRIATALGIRPDDIARAKNDVGGLAKFLDDKFKAFELAGERAAGTFAGTFRRAQTAIALSAGEAAKPLFEEIRSAFLQTFETFTERDPFGNLIPNPQAVKVLAAVFDGIADAVKVIRDNAKQISFDQLLSAAQALGGFFKGLGQVVTGFAKGFISVIGNLGRVLGQLFKGVDLVQFSTILGGLITTIGLLGAAFGTLHIAVSALLLPMRTLVDTASTLGAAFKLIGNPFIGILAAATAVVFTLDQIKEDQKDVNDIIAASKPEAQLSGIAALDRQIKDLLATQQKLSDNRGIVSAILGLDQVDDKQIDEISAKVTKLRAEMAKLAEQRKADQQAGKGRDTFAGLDAPNLGERGIAERAAEFAAKLMGQVQAAVNQQPGIEPKINVEDVALTEQEKADLSVFRPATAEEIAAFKASGELRSKIALDQFGEALTKMADITEAGLNLMRSAITEFGSFVADTIVDAFDPTNDTSFKERFARFLQSLARQIIATLTQIAVAKLLLNIGVGAAGGTTVASGGGFVEGFADGGPVKGPRRGVIIPRPASVPSSDTVPAWLTPGEFVQKASAVARYGADAMDALNSGLIDPMQFRELAGLSAQRSRNFRRAQRIAFADGGLVADAVATQQAAAASIPGAGAGAPTPAFIVGNDAAVDRFLRGGKAAFMDFARENASSLKAILGQ